MEKTRRKILRQAKSYFSDSEYKRYFRALKTLDSHKVSLDQTLTIQETLFTILPEFNILYASLFFQSEQISSSIKKRFLNKIQLRIHKKIQILRSFSLTDEDSEKKLLKILFLAFTEKPRILYFFLAYQFSLSQTIHLSSLDVQVAYAIQLFKIVAPLAKRMGIRKLYETFESIAFSVLFVDDYKNISQQRSEYVKKEKFFMRKISDKIRYYLKKEGLHFQISHRVKSIYSIYKKLKKKGRTNIEILNDIFAIRIIVENVSDCYKILGIIHQKFPHIPGKIKDYISLPKPNSYQSLHTILQISADDDTLPFEVQIRTKEMNEVASSGMAAHMFYKKNDTKIESNKMIKKKIALLSKQLSSQNFLQNAEKDLFNNFIFVFTKNNKIFPIERGSTALDFALSIHSDLGFYCKDVFINGEECEKGTILQNGDKIEITKSNTTTIDPSWVKYSRNIKMQKKIISFFSSE